MKTIIVLLGVVGYSYSSDWSFSSGHGDEGLTLGEISIDHHGGGLKLGETGGHSLSFGENHSPFLNTISDGYSSHGDIGSSHGANFIPVIKHIGIPMINNVPISVPHPVIETIPQPYPVAVLIPKSVPYEVEKPVIKTVEKKIPTPVEKIIPIKIEKLVPIHVVKHIPVPIPKPFPIKIPIYKTIVHKVKSH